MTDDRLLKSLQTLGLTLNEARIFITLTKLGTTEATEIARVSEVPRSKIYATLGKLTEKMFITAEDSEGSVKYYKTIGIKQGIQRLKENILSSVENSAQYAIQQLEATQGSLQKKPIPEQELWTLKGSDKIIQVAIEMIENAQNQIIFSFLPDFIAPIQEALEDAKGRKISIQLLLPAPYSQEISETISLDKIVTEIASFNLDTLASLLEMIPSEIIPIDGENLKSKLTVLLKSLPNLLTIDPERGNYCSLLILRSEDPKTRTIAIQFLNKDFIDFQVKLVRLVWDLVASLGQVKKF